MPDIAWGLLCALVSYFAFALLALSQERHWHDLLHEEQPTQPLQRQLHIAGAFLLGAALGLALLSQGAAFGSLLWMVMVSAAALAVSFTLSWKPQLLKPLARGVHRLRGSARVIPPAES